MYSTIFLLAFFAQNSYIMKYDFWIFFNFIKIILINVLLSSQNCIYFFSMVLSGGCFFNKVFLLRL